MFSPLKNMKRPRQLEGGRQVNYWADGYRGVVMPARKRRRLEDRSILDYVRRLAKAMVDLPANLVSIMSRSPRLLPEHPTRYPQDADNLTYSHSFFHPERSPGQYGGNIWAWRIPVFWLRNAAGRPRRLQDAGMGWAGTDRMMLRQRNNEQLRFRPTQN